MTSTNGQGHTKGPWKQTGLIVRQDCGDRLGPQIARVAGPEVAVDAECEANARLIAAAPDLLEALQRAETAVAELCQDQNPANECWNILREVRSALSRVSGEGR